MYAVIRAGGKQYKVASGDVIDVDRLKADAGAEVSFEPVLLVDGDTMRARASELDGTSVKGRVVAHKRGKKIKVFNYHRKTGWKRTKGHRSELTTVEITEIV
jgi:large subunit ribosomal protein L21